MWDTLRLGIRGTSYLTPYMTNYLLSSPNPLLGGTMKEHWIPGD
jgi:hypothetical protein